MSFYDLENQKSIVLPQASQKWDDHGVTELASLAKLLKREIHKVGGNKDGPHVREYIKNDLIPRILTGCKQIEDREYQSRDLDERVRKLYNGQLKHEIEALLKDFGRKELHNPLPTHTDVETATQTGLKKAGNNEIDTASQHGESSHLLQKQLQIDQHLVDEQELSYQSIIQEERSRDIATIRGKVGEINTVFKQLGDLVKEQGSKVDTVDNNIQSLTTALQNSNKQLHAADEHQRKKNKCSMVVLIVLIVIILIVVLGIVS